MKRNITLGIIITAFGVPACAALMLLGLFFMGQAEGPGHSVYFENRTPGAIWLYEGGELDFSFPAGETLTVATSQRFWNEHLTARDENNNLVWQADITWDQLKEIGYRVVVEVSPPPDATPGPQQETSSL